ncbi:MAG: hypothetical protein Q8936_21250 [Bacillota bacterium]|nr:hypothetical protein [Bacillota bacterium]
MENVNKPKEKMYVAVEQIDIKNTIKATAKETAEEVVTILKNKNMINDNNYYKKVEKILYNYNNLKESIKEKDVEIEELKEYGLKEKSKSVTVYCSGGSNSTLEDRYLEKLEKCNYEKQEIARYIKKIDKALAKIKSSKYFEIIDLKYLKIYEEDEKKITDDELAEKFGVERITIIRNRKGLINKLITTLFPESIIE